MEKRMVKIFGERNTGTRLLAKMLNFTGAVTLRMPRGDPRMNHAEWSDLTQAIQRNYDGQWRRIFLEALRDDQTSAEYPLSDWKHAAARWHADYAFYGVSAVFLTRNPYSWAISMARRPYHMKAPRAASFEQFVTRPWIADRRDGTRSVFPNIMGLWSEKMRSYVAFSNHAIDPAAQHLQFEFLVTEPVEAVGALLTALGTTSQNIRRVEHSTKDNDRPADEIARYYRNEDWRALLSKGRVEMINAGVDWPVAEAFGYQRLNPDEFSDEADAKADEELRRIMILGVRARSSKRKAGAAAAA